MGDDLRGFFQRVEAEPSAEFTEELLTQLRTEFETGEPADQPAETADDAEGVVVALATIEGRDGRRGDDESRTHSPRRRWVPLAAAVVVAVIAATALLAIREWDDREQNLDVVEGRPGLSPTVERLQGVWLEDSGTGTVRAPLLARFGSDGTFSLGGVFDQQSWTYGTFEVEDHRINFTVAGGACSSRDVFAWDATIVTDGRLEGAHAGAVGDQPGQLGNCDVPVGEPRAFTRVSPPSSAAAGISPGFHVGGAVTSETRPGDLEGFWLMEATGLLLWFDSSGDYRLDDAGELAASPDDSGTVEIGSQTLRFTSGGLARECVEGDVMVWSNVRVEDGRLRGVVDEDACDRGLPDEVTLLFLNIDSP